MSFQKNKIKSCHGFSLLELVVAISIISITSSLVIPFSLSWLRTEKVNAYTRELSEFFRLVRLEARRWGSSCFIYTNNFDYESIRDDKKYMGFVVNCKYTSTPYDGSKINVGRIQELVPALNNSFFQVVNNNFQVTPNGRISASKPIIIVIGSKYHKTRPKILNCITINIPTGQIKKGKFNSSFWLLDNMPVSQLSNNAILIPERCEF
tara:strand:+ start:1555 stop:2178 length:624 start_codon:yes stop_codon:yes gene_type:complete